MFARTVVQINPLAAVTWAASISDKEMRRTALDATISHWSQDDPDAASSWADENGIDTSELPEILRTTKE